MGPLAGIRIIEMAGIGPGPLAAMMLADMGAEVIRVDRSSGSLSMPGDFINRGRKSIAVNLKSPEGVETVLKLIESADALIEGFRPGVMEKLGLAPDAVLARNPRLVYGRMTGWGQTGPLAHAAGHDINYIAITGALDAIGTPEKPLPPVNFAGDTGGGAMFLVMGLLAAMLEAKNSGQGQVVDAAICDGAVMLMANLLSFKSLGMWNGARGHNILDGAAHFYDSYECADGKFVAVGAIETPFYMTLMDKMGLELDTADIMVHMDPNRWPEQKARLAEVFKQKTRDEWCAILEGTDACFAPVLSVDEAPHHPHNAARGNFLLKEGKIHPAPAPRFSRTPSQAGEDVVTGADTDAVLAGLGLSAEQIEALKQAGAVK